MPGAPGHLDQDERELADLGQPHADQHGGADRLAEQPHHQRPQHELAHDDEGDHGAEQRQVVHDQRRIDERTDGDEEERHEGVADGQHARERLVRVVGPADEQAGQECPERQGQPHRLGQRRRAEPDGEGDQEEQLVVLGPRHARHDRRYDLGRQIGEGHQDERGLAEGRRDGEQAAGLERPEGGDQHDQDHHREILHEA